MQFAKGKPMYKCIASKLEQYEWPIKLEGFENIYFKF